MRTLYCEVREQRGVALTAIDVGNGGATSLQQEVEAGSVGRDRRDSATKRALVASSPASTSLPWPLLRLGWLGVYQGVISHRLLEQEL